MTSSLIRRQVFMLAGAQALFQTTAVTVLTVGGLAGALVSSDPRVATVPIASMMFGTVVGTVPASMWMARVGRRAGFLSGALFGVAGGGLAAAGLFLQSLLLLAAGTFLFGVYQGFAQFYRYAAGEVADDAYRPRAISLVLAGGIAAAFMGPAIGQLGGPLLTTPYAGSFVLLAAISAMAVLLLSRLQLPAVAAAAAGTVRPLWQIVRQPVYLTAWFGAATGSGVMILAMTATPIAMMHHHHGLPDAAQVIQMHVLGMFVPSFFTGGLIARFGVLKVMLTGVALLAAHVLVTLSGTGFQSFATALVLLGVGWNFLYIGGTTLLTTTYTPAERGRAQAANDLSVYIVGLFSSLTAGALLEAVGWQRMNVLLLPWLAVAAVVLLVLGWRQRRAEGAQSMS